MSGVFGRGEAIGHAGEVLQGAVRLGGRLEPFLVTLPAPVFRSEATVRRAEAWSVQPSWKSKALRAVQLACQFWGVDGAFTVEIDSAIPVGRGCGSSTADCVAALRALRPGAPPEEIALLAQQAETACDSTMFGGEPLAFLPRRGEILRRFEGGWPAMDISIVDLGGPPVDTVTCPMPAYSNSHIEEFAELLECLAHAIGAGDAAGVGRVASRSAAIHRRYRTGVMPRVEGALGVALAHSGTVAGVLSAGPMNLPGCLAAYSVGKGVRHGDLVCRWG